jgi:prepilin-type N-terminal cleavage/methylation domain-containing protein
MRRLLLKKSNGFTIIELLIVVMIIGTLTAIAIPNLRAAQKKSKYSRGASDTKTAVTQGIIYANDRNSNPGNTTTLRTQGYANVPDADPWNGTWIYSAAYASTATPATQGEMAVCSKGPTGTMACALPITNSSTGTDGEVGYSSIYGSFQGTT